MAWAMAILLGPVLGPVMLAQSDPKLEPADFEPRAATGHGWIAGIGLDAARRRFGDDLPTGQGVVFGHVEGAPGQYAPDTGSPRFEGVSFTHHGPSTTKPFGHATSTARYIYGPSGAAPGVSEVHLFPATQWLGRGYLGSGWPLPSRVPNVRVFTHSWISHHRKGSDRILRRLDALIETTDLIVCAGVNNKAKSSVPPLLSSSYNAIAVGVVSGDNSSGYTVFEGAGRCKPDLVAPGRFTSFSTPLTAAVCARLLEFADRSAEPDDHRLEVVKAALLAGAYRGRFWVREPGKPLDKATGAGVVDLHRALVILERGATALPAGDLRATSRRAGFAFDRLEPKQTAVLTLTTDRPQGAVGVALVWNRRVGGRTLDQPRLADFDLRMERIDPAAGPAALVQASSSRIDNVELLHLPSLEPGAYRLTVERRDDGLAERWDYALAWIVDADG